MRSILSLYTGLRPGSISYLYGERGKPSLATHAGPAKLRFSVSSSGPFAIYSVTEGREVGVDLERIRPFQGMGKLATRFFSPQENRAFQSTDGNEQVDLFYGIWTAKEAYLKGTGEGLSGNLFESSIEPPGDGRRVRVFSRGAWKEVPWATYLFKPEGGLKACVAVQQVERS